MVKRTFASDFDWDEKHDVKKSVEVYDQLWQRECLCTTCSCIINIIYVDCLLSRSKVKHNIVAILIPASACSRSVAIYKNVWEPINILYYKVILLQCLEIQLYRIVTVNMSRFTVDTDYFYLLLRDRSIIIGGLGPVQKVIGHILFLSLKQW